jgi:uncharacterized protein YecE (DUF72 family)
MSPAIEIGTSGWSYAHWRGSFYPDGVPQKDWLQFYAGVFGSVEVNGSFYRLPTQHTVEMWVKNTGADFCFAVKAWNMLTHRKKLHDCADLLERFMEILPWFGAKLGPLLFQLPPRWHCNLQRLDDFVGLLPGKYRYVMEFRDHSWLNEDVYGILRKRNIACCVYDLGGFQSPTPDTADFRYIRLHGPGDAYRGSYSGPALKKWASVIQQWRQQGQDIYVYFDNDEQGYAAKNALQLKNLLG